MLARKARVVVRTDAPRWLFPADVEWIESRGWPLDVGVVQRDGLELSIDDTRERWREFARCFDERATIEAHCLRSSRAEVVLGDIPPLAFAAATRAGLPSFALGNFTWDWIYSAWPDFDDIVASVRGGYAQADVLLRLPLHGQMDAFKRIEDVPLIVRYARRRREDVRAQLGLPQKARAVLISFGGFTAHGLALTELGQWMDYLFVLTPPLGHDQQVLPANVCALNQTPADYVSLLAACDAVITKPGYGMVADCLANRVPMLFTDRGPFREYDVLAEALPRLGRARYIPRQDLMRGAVGPHLDALFESNTPWTEQPMHGAETVAARVVPQR